jgi:Uma2 family endonuclease
MDDRLTDYFASGAQIVWIIHPEEQFVEVCHSRTERRIVGLSGSLDGEHLLPGFRLPVADLFKAWDWQ